MAKKTLKELKSEKVASVMHEGKIGELHAGKGGKITKNTKQILAIALSEASKVKLPKKKK
jgi:hypothetical protein